MILYSNLMVLRAVDSNILYSNLMVLRAVDSNIFNKLQFLRIYFAQILSN